jgi:uncharacterized protein (TIGR03435 family)
MIVARSAFLLAAIVCSSVAADEVFEAVFDQDREAWSKGQGPGHASGTMKMMNLSLSDMVQAGYGVQAFQIIPKDLPDARYEIVATAPDHPSRVLDGSYEKMIQAMLADRFALKLHRESKVMQVYVLEIAKGGPKLKKSDQPGLSTHSSPGHVTATRRQHAGCLRVSLAPDRAAGDRSERPEGPL